MIVKRCKVTLGFCRSARTQTLVVLDAIFFGFVVVNEFSPRIVVRHGIERKLFFGTLSGCFEEWSDERRQKGKILVVCWLIDWWFEKCRPEEAEEVDDQALDMRSI